MTKNTSIVPSNTRSEKIQISDKDLSDILQIGPIADMYVVIQNNRQVLRIEYVEKAKKEEYEVVKYTGPKRASKPRASSHPPRKEVVQDPEGLGSKLMDHAKGWWRNKTPPDFMTREFKKW
jgi:hypothetical protein